jgi:hypothetical protein
VFCVGDNVAVAAVVEVGMGVDVTVNVDEGVEKSNVGAAFVDVEKSIVLVGVGVFVGVDVFVDVTAGVRVGMFGTQRSCPA